ncbi:putative ribonuclease H-like domain-containing protein [Tanacetum coccineum]
MLKELQAQAQAQVLKKMAFVSSPSSTNEVNIAYGVNTANTQVSPASTQVSTTSTQVSTTNLSDDTVYAFLASQPNGSQLVYEDLEKIHEDDIEEMDLKCQLAFYMADDEVPTNMALMAFSDFEKSNLSFTKKNEVIFYEQLVVLKRDISYKDSEISMLKSQLEKLEQEKESNQLKIENFDNASKSLDKLIGSQITDKNRKGVGFISYNAVPPPPTGLFSPPKFDLSNSSLEEFQQPEFEGYGPKTSKSVSEDISNKVRESSDAPLVKELVSDDKLEKKTAFPTVAKIKFANCNYHQRERVVYGNNYTKMNYNYSAKKAYPSAHRNIVSRAVLMKTGLRSLNTTRPVNTAHPKTTVYSARPMPKAVNTARPNSAVVNVMRANQGHPQKEDQGYVDSGCSRHMTGNMSYLSNFKEFDGGYVTFGGGANGGKITGKGTLKSRCFVLSPDFKLADESQVLLKVPRKNNMYSVDMKNIIPKESLTCLVAKSTLDESMLWHRRLEFKNRVMSEFCEKKGIKKEFSVSRTPQQNGVAERRNKTLIEAARTMLVDSKLPTIVWAEAVNTACYVQNRVLVVKTHKKTLYELFRGRTPSLSFMRPFGCHVTILNTLDYLGKFDGKSDKGFFFRYSLNSKAFRVSNIRTRKVEESLHIRFLEDKPIIAGDGPKWLFDIDILTKSMNYVPVVTDTNSNDFAGTEESIGAGHSSKETRSSQDYILMPLWKDGSLFDSSSKNAINDKPQPSSDAGKKDDEGVNKESGIDDQERPKNSTRDINNVGPSINTTSINVNTGSLNINIVSPIVTTALLKATHADFFGDETEVDMSNITATYLVPSTPNTRIHKDHSLDHVIGDVQSGVQTRRMARTTNEQGFIKPKKVIQALKDPSWIEAMQEELLQFKLQQVWTLVDLLHGKRAIGTKWVYKNKKDERGIVIRNKVWLVAQGYTQEEGIDYDEVFAPVARIEAIQLFLAYASFKYFVVYQMDMKSAFLYGKIEEEFYVCQPLGFEDLEFPDRVYKVEKALYCLHQAPRAWVKSDILLVQVYVDDIIFGSTKKELCIEFEKLMHKKFQMSSMGELTFFLGLQVTQKDDGIFISQDKYMDEILKKFGFSTVKTTSTPMETSKPLLKDAEAEDVDVHLYRSMIGSLMYLTSSRPDIMFAICQPKLGLWYPKDSPFDLEAYTDSDYAGASLDRKSTTGGCQFLGSRLISWQCKKQTIVANSTTEAEYVAAASCCGQVL